MRKRNSLGESRLDSRIPQVVLRSPTRLYILSRVIVPDCLFLRDLHKRLERSASSGSREGGKSTHISWTPPLPLPPLHLAKLSLRPISSIHRLPAPLIRERNTKMRTRSSRRTLPKVALRRRLSLTSWRRPDARAHSRSRWCTCSRGSRCLPERDLAGKGRQAARLLACRLL